MNLKEEMDVFIQKIFSGKSTWKTPDPSIDTVDIAWFVQNTDLGPLRNTLQKLKLRCTNSIPIVALLYYYSLENEIDINSFIISNADKNNLEIYNLLTTSMSLQNMITAAINSKQTKFLETMRLEIWQLTMESTLLDNFRFPENIPRDITKHVILRNCKQKADFLEKIPTTELRKLTGDNNLLNLKKTELCTVVTDMNMLSKNDIKHKINKCNLSIDQIDPNYIDKTVRKDLEEKLRKFSNAAEDWTDLTLYDKYCDSETRTDCKTRLDQLHVISSDVITLANTCMGTIDSLVKNGLIKKRKSGEKLNWKETFRSYW